MGNHNKTVLNSQQRFIVIDQKQGKSLWLNELPVFPHGFDGLHIWEAGIVLARYILYHKQLFKNKRILEIGTGVGIAGISALKFTQCTSCVLSDYQPQILQNVKNNLVKNKIKTANKVVRLDWFDYMNYPDQFDIIIGSDVVYFGCPVKELYQLLKKATYQESVVHILIPDRKNYADLFLRQIQPSVFHVYKRKLYQLYYRQSPLPNKVQGLKEYNLLVDVDFYVYTLVKKPSVGMEVHPSNNLGQQTEESPAKQLPYLGQNLHPQLGRESQEAPSVIRQTTENSQIQEATHKGHSGPDSISLPNQDQLSQNAPLQKEQQPKETSNEQPVESGVEQDKQQPQCPEIIPSSPIPDPVMSSSPVQLPHPQVVQLTEDETNARADQTAGQFQQ